ncbi:hypothetical protein [Alkalimarinus alittae]|uniref:Uncharacterized protein n=1 Tax=Alkalimarinus alittae TaxID=2961619 RepID=A0ABY6N3E3_9ALTE|nr:hypothetical protein [Alkalimarinus alittae]UZE96614.1 hypothetical protein NKI27_02360 [Alkalimarinus alittae]
MTNIETPTYLQDAAQLLSADGFKLTGTWYHGTSSDLTDSIMDKGLIGSGDAELNKMAKQTMAAIGNSYTERKEPIFLTQSKELAYYWANEKAELRKTRFGSDATPVVVELTLPEDLASKVKTDVGAATMLLTGNDPYIEYIQALYTQNKILLPKLDPTSIDRMAYLNVLGLAYLSVDVPADHLNLLTR